MWDQVLSTSGGHSVSVMKGAAGWCLSGLARRGGSQEMDLDCACLPLPSWKIHEIVVSKCEIGAAELVLAA